MFDVEVRLFLGKRVQLGTSQEIDDGNEKPCFDWLRLNLVSWREPIERFGKKVTTVRDRKNRSQEPNIR